MTPETNYVETRNKLSQGYDEIAHAIGSMPRYFYPTAARFVGPVDGCRLLDLGCGNGYLLREIVRRQPNAPVAGIDFSRALLSNARTQVPSGSFCLGDLNTSLPFADASYDLVILSEVYEHLLQPRGLLDEMHRVVKPEGECVITFPNADGFALYRRLGERLVSAAERFQPLKHLIPFEHPTRTSQPIDALLHYEEMVATIRAAGFQITHIAGGEVCPELFAVKGLRHFDYFHPRLRLWLSERAVRTGHAHLCYRVFFRCRPLPENAG